MSDSVTPWTVAHQAPLSVGFSRQEYWSGLPFPSPKGHFLLSSLLLSKFHYQVHREHNRKQVAQESENWWANQNDSTGAPQGSWTVRDARPCEGAVTVARPRWQGKEGFLRPEERGATAACQGQPGRGFGKQLPWPWSLSALPHPLETKESQRERNPKRSASQGRAEKECYQIMTSIRPLLGC